MTPIPSQQQLWRQPGLRVQTLVRLRWLAILGQALALVIVHYGLRFETPFWPAMSIVMLSAWLNVVLMLRWHGGARLRENAAMAVLAFDIVQLAVLLYLTGGLANPFSLLFLAPVTVSATSLGTWRTLLLGLLALACISLLVFLHMPLPWRDGEPPAFPPLYLFGLWGALASGIVFTGMYVHRIARENWQMAEALRATELVLARQQQLYALDGLAAAAAHELSTPLATIAVVIRELRKACANCGEDDEERRLFCDDLELIHSQAERCRDILRELADHRARRDEMLAQVRLGAMLEEIIEPLRGPDLDIRLVRGPVEGEAEEAEAAEPTIWRDPGIFYGLGNIIENACDFAERRVLVEAEWERERISITITDDGPGFSEDVMNRLGEPFITTRASQFLLVDDEAGEGEMATSGMGLGFFIAKTLLERSGATISIANRPQPQHGAIVRIDWPRAAIEVPRAERGGSGTQRGEQPEETA